MYPVITAVKVELKQLSHYVVNPRLIAAQTVAVLKKMQILFLFWLLSKKLKVHVLICKCKTQQEKIKI